MVENRSKMLVVDDYSMMARVMKAVAQGAGFEHVDMCYDGETALKLLRASRHDVVLCDLEMQPISGDEFARRARLEAPNSDCVILLTTASPDRAAAALRNGAHLFIDGVILKPFNAKELRAKIVEIRNRAQQPSAGENDAAP